MKLVISLSDLLTYKKQKLGTLQLKGLLFTQQLKK